MHKIQLDLRKLANKKKQAIYKNFHKTDENGYASEEEFLGITVPQLRELAQKYISLSYQDIINLLHSKIHEEKYIATIILAEKYELQKENRKEIFHFYIDNSELFSGWDLVDSTAPYISGHYLFHLENEYPKYSSILPTLAKSDNLWRRRISIISTYYFIKQNKFEETIKLAEILLHDKHDLIHKAVGWMLREMGKRNQSLLEDFLKKHYKQMPRTMLRYAIERFPEKLRKAYLHGDI